jgi:hypothetical protein
LTDNPNKEPIDILNIRDWLKAPDPSTNFVAACNMKTPGTGEWLLSDSQFVQWRENKSGMLWIQGKGKILLYGNFESKYSGCSGLRQNIPFVRKQH